MAEQITIPISIFEVTIRYEQPVIRLLADRVAIVQALFDTFAEYEPNPDDLEAVTTGKTTEQGIKLRLASQRVSLFFGATGCKFTKEAAVWAEADKILGILSSFLNILTKMGEARLGKRNAVLSLHLQPKTVSFQVYAPLSLLRFRNSIQGP
jgi:hypothetical protein